MQSNKMESSEAVDKLNAILTCGSRDPERAHLDADSILLEFLMGQGFREVVDAYEKVRISVFFYYS
jgi:hypothetical protein